MVALQLEELVETVSAEGDAFSGILPSRPGKILRVAVSDAARDGVTTRHLRDWDNRSG